MVILLNDMWFLLFSIEAVNDKSPIGGTRPYLYRLRTVLFLFALTAGIQIMQSSCRRGVPSPKKWRQVEAKDGASSTGNQQLTRCFPTAGGTVRWRRVGSGNKIWRAVEKFEEGEQIGFSAPTCFAITSASCVPSSPTQISTEISISEIQRSLTAWGSSLWRLQLAEKYAR